MLPCYCWKIYRNYLVISMSDSSLLNLQIQQISAFQASKLPRLHADTIAFSTLEVGEQSQANDE